MVTPSNYLDDAALAMVAAAERGRSIAAVLKKKCPEIDRQIRLDERYPEMLAAWGRSSNVDENAGLEIVRPPILQLIGDLANVPMRGRFVHAGLAHTYGYLFSLIDTPYGPKRTRWVTTALEDGFGLEPTLLGDRPTEGTLLGNLTRFLVGIAFRGEEWERGEWSEAKEIARFEYERLQVMRIVERASTPQGELQLFTDLVPFPNPPSDPRADNTLLIYTAQLAHQKWKRLITAFPMKPVAVEELKATVSKREVPIRLRYNAYVRGLYGKTFAGSRQFLSE